MPWSPQWHTSSFISVDSVNEKVYCVSGEQHRRIHVSVWKLAACTRPVAGAESSKAES